MNKVNIVNGGNAQINFNQTPLYMIAKQHHLTPRETEVFQLVAIYGYTNAQAAEVLNTEKKTVSNHMYSLLKKMGCASTRELLSKIIQVLLPEDFNDDAFEKKLESYLGIDPGNEKALYMNK